MKKALIRIFDFDSCQIFAWANSVRSRLQDTPNSIFAEDGYKDVVTSTKLAEGAASAYKQANPKAGRKIRKGKPKKH
jgi:hypothetical protein